MFRICVFMLVYLYTLYTFFFFKLLMLKATALRYQVRVMGHALKLQTLHIVIIITLQLHIMHT